MSKPWVGFLAAVLLFLGGLFELIGENPKLGIFLMVMSVVSFFLRLYFIRKISGGKDQNY
jgi:hypothetical protein